MRILSLTLLTLLALLPCLLVAQTATAPEGKTWPCRPAPVQPSGDFDPEVIYLGSRPSLLPDGKKFIFEWCDAIWIAPVEGGTATVLQHSTGRDAWPVASRDGKRFAFQSNRAGAWHVFVADIAEGAEAHQVGYNSEAERPYMWSLDDQQLLCWVLRDDPGSIFDQGRLAWLPVNKRGAEQRIFDAPGSDPSLSPDGRYLLFTQEGDDLYRKGFEGENASRIWCYDTQTHAFTLAVKKPTESRYPLWAPDGKGFYYISGEGGTQNLWYHAFPSREERQLTFFKGDSVVTPTISADGRTMVFRQGFDFWRFDPKNPTDSLQRIRLVPEDKGLARTQTKRRYYASLWNNDSPGALTATNGGMEFAFTAGGDLYVMDTVLRDPHCVYGDSRTHERECIFSKDGSRLYFTSDRGDNVAILLAEKKRPDRFWWENSEFNIRPLVEDDKRRELLSISPDGKRLAWVETDSVLVIADAEGRVFRRFPGVKQVGNYDWSPDGRWIVAALSDDYANFDIWLLSIDDLSIPAYNLSRSFKWEGNPTWSPDGKIITWVGERTGSGTNLFYVWLYRTDEEALIAQNYIKAIEHMGISASDRSEVPQILGGATVASTPDPNSPNADALSIQRANAANTIDFSDLHTRVHSIPIPGISYACFAPDSRRLLFPANVGGRRGTYEITLPDDLTPRFVCDRWGYAVGWFGRDPDPLRADRLLLHTSDNKIGTLYETYDFQVYQELSVPDYQELGFLLAWGTLRDVYYDDNYHGADWEAVRAKYQAPARFAPGRAVFQRIIAALNGELNSSHLGFYDDDNSEKEWDPPNANRQGWEPITSHLGIVFDQSYTGPTGWRVQSIIPKGPADSEQIDLHPGDIVLAIDGTPIQTGTDPTLLLNGPRTGKYILDVWSRNTQRKVYIEAITYGTARELVRKAMYENRRAYVHKRSDSKLGYINITQMNDSEYNRFELEIFAEGFDKDGMVIDVRDNTGGFTADRVLNILCVQRHSWSVPRHGDPAYLAGYWGRPVFDKPIVVLCNQNTVSNGEIFSHAIKQLGRGKLVGVQTNGGVIATSDAPLLDLGVLRHAGYGWYTLDGTDMELHGALPDVIVENTPADTAAGRDPQLDAAIDILLEDVKTYKQNHAPFVPNTYKWNHQP